MTTIAIKQPSSRVDYRRLWWVGILAAGLAVLLNVVLFWVGGLIGAFPTTYIIPQSGTPLPVQAVIMASLIGVIGGVVTFALLGLFTKHPARIYAIVGIIVLVLSFVTPFTLPDPPMLMVVFLQLMHIVAAAVAIWVPIRFAVAPPA